MPARALGRRFAGGAFVAYAVYGWFTFHPTTAEDWIGIALWALLASGLAWGVSLIVLAVLNFAYTHTVGHPWAKPGGFGT